MSEKTRAYRGQVRSVGHLGMMNPELRIDALSQRPGEEVRQVERRPWQAVVRRVQCVLEVSACHGKYPLRRLKSSPESGR
jgi:hypothetical protein